jgi:hypothetical protein
MSNKINIIGKPKKRKLYEIKIYTQQENLKDEHIIGKIKRNQEDILNYAEVLNEEENNLKKKKHLKKKSKEIDELSEKTEKKLSDKSSKIINDVNRIISNMNESTEELKKLNALFLIGTSKKINKTNNIQSENLEELKYSKEIKDEKLIEEDEKNKLENKKKKPFNFTYINDNYRKQLNRAFMNFNPIIHLGNLNLLRKADPSINEDIAKLEEHINKDLKSIIDPHYYKHQYEKLLKEHEKLRKGLKTAPTENYNINNYTYNPSLTTNSNKTNNSIPVYRKRKLKNKLEIKRKFPDKELRLKELKNMDDCLKQISKSINDDNINNYYNNYNNLRNYSIQQQTHTYFPDIRKANDIMREIQQDRLIRGLNKETKNKKKYVENENNKIVEQISKGKDLLLKDIIEIEK